MYFCFLFFVYTHEQFTISLKYSRNRTYSCHLTPLYIKFRSDTYKLYPRYLLADVLKMCKTARQDTMHKLGFSSLESCLFPSLIFILADDVGSSVSVLLPLSWINRKVSTHCDYLGVQAVSTIYI